MTQEKLDKLQEYINYLGRQADTFSKIGREEIRARYIAEIDGIRRVLEMIGYTVSHRQIVKEGE